MATSGTVGTTVLDTALFVEHACRRGGVPTSKQTPELVNGARESLYMLMVSLANRGLNLWCVERFYQGLVSGQVTYQMPAGTVTVLNAIYSQPTLLDTTTTTTTTSTTATITSGSTVQRVGVKFSTVTAADALTIAVSSDGVSWTTVASKSGDLSTTYAHWFQLDPGITTAVYVKASTALPSASEMYVASAIYDLPLTPWSRDTWMAINNKTQTGRPSTNYFLERKVSPNLTLWPVPSSSTDHLTLYRHRQVQDVGTLTEQIEVPERWLENISWQLAFRVAAESPVPDQNRIQLCSGMADKTTVDVEGEETDGAPISLVPRVRGYTR